MPVGRRPQRSGSACPDASGRPLGRVDSIDSHLLQSWLDLA
jgi:hypothetical protein